MVYISRTGLQTIFGYSSVQVDVLVLYYLISVRVVYMLLS